MAHGAVHRAMRGVLRVVLAHSLTLMFWQQPKSCACVPCGPNQRPGGPGPALAFEGWPCPTETPNCVLADTPIAAWGKRRQGRVKDACIGCGATSASGSRGITHLLRRSIGSNHDRSMGSRYRQGLRSRGRGRGLGKHSGGDWGRPRAAPRLGHQSIAVDFEISLSDNPILFRLRKLKKLRTEWVPLQVRRARREGGTGLMGERSVRPPMSSGAGARLTRLAS